MKHSIILTSLVCVVTFTGCVYTQERETSSPLSISTTTSPASHQEIHSTGEEPTSTTSTGQQFILSLIERLPDTYIVKQTEYYELLSLPPKPATQVTPCDNTSFTPLCLTAITFVVEKKTPTLQDYIAQNALLRTHEARVNDKLVTTTYEGNIHLAYTNRPFMCLGTGAETCMRKQFIYHLEDGTIVIAEMSFWPFEDDQYTGTISQDVQDVLTLYENVLQNRK